MVDVTRAGPTTGLQNSTLRGDEYVVQRGDTLWGIARQHGISLGALEAANPQLAKHDFIFPGDRVALPTGEGGSSRHVVRSGETISGIASANHVSTDAIVAANHLQHPDRIYPGNTLTIPHGQAPAMHADPAPAVVPRTAPPRAPATQPAEPATTTATMPARPGGSPDLRAMFDPQRGSSALGAVVIGQAEGTRTPSGGFNRAYYSHVDPGNGVVNRGSFSLQHAEQLSPEQADVRQLTRLNGQIPTFETAARNAGLDPNDPALATAYLDLYNQSQSAAGRFLDQLDYLSTNGVSTTTLVELRVRSFVDHTTGERFRLPGGGTAGGGFANIARQNLGRTPTEREVQAVIRADQNRRLTAMAAALPAANAAPVNRAQPTTTAPAAAPAPRTAAPRTAAPETPQAARFTSNPGLDLSPAIVRETNGLYDAVRTQTGFNLHVTSGRRGPERQATAMYNNFADNSSPTYANRQAFAEVRNAFTSGRAEGLGRAGTIARMTNVLQAQVDRGVLISRHMSSRAIDIRMPPAASRAEVLSAIRGNPAVQSVGIEDDHLHIQFH